MNPFFKLLPGLAASLFLASCAVQREGDAPSRGGSYGPSEYGHRPGPRGFRTVIVDAGHGGHDSGATSGTTGQKEKDLALDTARRIAANLRKDFRVVMMRDDDTFVDLDDRVAFANRHGSAILVSMHYNSGPSGIRGPETFIIACWQRTARPWLSTRQ